MRNGEGGRWKVEGGMGKAEGGRWNWEGGMRMVEGGMRRGRTRVELRNLINCINKKEGAERLPQSSLVIRQPTMGGDNEKINRSEDAGIPDTCFYSWHL